MQTGAAWRRRPLRSSLPYGAAATRVTVFASPFLGSTGAALGVLGLGAVGARAGSLAFRVGSLALAGGLWRLLGLAYASPVWLHPLWRLYAVTATSVKHFRATLRLFWEILVAGLRP